ncbi:MAG TPA: ferredoxin reductase [Acidimicrobiia bacterium]
MTERDAPRPALAWQRAPITRISNETYRVRSYRFGLDDWRPFRPGQHVDVRLTAPDGYQALRSYSIASPPEESGSLDLTIEQVPDGEVSSWFHQVAQVGDEVELRGPIGGPFTWTVDEGGPVLLVGGGSGVVPLMSMLRHIRARGGGPPALLLFSSRTLADIIYRDELTDLASVPKVQVVHTLTRETPAGWEGYTRRVDAAMLGEMTDRVGSPVMAFICGPTAFVETVAVGLVGTGLDPGRIRTERFGPSG